MSDLPNHVTLMLALMHPACLFGRNRSRVFIMEVAQTRWCLLLQIEGTLRGPREQQCALVLNNGPTD